MNKILEYTRNAGNALLRAMGRVRPPTFLGRRSRQDVVKILLWGAALLLAILIFFGVRTFTSCWKITPLPGIPPASCGGAELNPLGTPVVSALSTQMVAGLPPTPDVPLPEVQNPQWDGGSRVNIVFFGLRGGESSGEGCPLCTDTIIVFTVDPVSKTAGMISVPRDMYVNIPGSSGCSGANDGYCRINTAWTTGEALKLPGGGPGEAMRTVSLFLGVPIQYYVQIDFDTFVGVINLIHGIDVYNTEDLLLKKLGGGKDGIRITCCGLRHLGGQAALAYARCRDVSQGCADGDVGRAQRQQKVILGIRDKVLDPKNFPQLMEEAPQLYQTFSSGIHTNMLLPDAIKLAFLVNQIPLDNIRPGVIDDKMVNTGNVTLGGRAASVVVPIPDKIRELRDEIFSTTGPTSPIATGDPKTLMQADAARIEVTNDTYTQGLDQRTGTFLVSQGMQVVALGQPTGASDHTVVVIYSPKLYALRYLMQPLGLIASSNQIFFKPDATSPVDIEIRLGNDWVSKLPAGY